MTLVVSDKFKHSDDGFKYFIGYKEGEIVKPLFIILPQISGYIKYFENGGKSMSFVMCLDKNNGIWDKIKGQLNIKFHSMPVYDEKHIKAKVREFNGVIKTDFLRDEIPKEDMHYTCTACITTDSVMRMEKKRIIHRFIQKSAKMTKFINTKLESESESEPESDIELGLTSESESDTK